MTVTAFPVIHSTRAPAVGYRLAAGRRTVFYVPDVVAIKDRARALAGVDLYVGDGATLVRSMVRRHGEALFGHAPVRTQLGWCRAEGVRRAVFSHCGTEVVTGKAGAVNERLAALAGERGVAASLAFDGQTIILR